MSREARDFLADRRLLLISPYHPEAGFNVGNAMGRNKLIYALADYALVVSADHKKGGTWEGAQEELRRKPARPVFVRLGDSVPMGNRKLIDLGAVAFPSIAGSQDPAALLRGTVVAKPPQEEEEKLPLFGEFTGGTEEVAVVREAAPVWEEVSTARLWSAGPAPASIYDVVLPVILSALDKSTSVVELAKRLDVSKAQLEVWLKRALNEKKIRKLNRPVRYARGD